MKILLFAFAAAVVLFGFNRMFGAPKGTSRIARPEDGPDEIERLLMAGRKIEAIKMHRRLQGTGLKESKEAIEALAARLESEGPRGAIEP